MLRGCDPLRKWLHRETNHYTTYKRAFNIVSLLTNRKRCIERQERKMKRNQEKCVQWGNWSESDERRDSRSGVEKGSRFELGRVLFFYMPGFFVWPPSSRYLLSRFVLLTKRFDQTAKSLLTFTEGLMFQSYPMISSVYHSSHGFLAETLRHIVYQ